MYVLLLLALAGTWILAWSGARELPGGPVPTAVVVLLAGLYSWFRFYDDVLDGIEPGRAPPGLLGGYSAGELQDLLVETNEPFRRDFGGTELPTLYVVESKEGNALTMKALILKFVRRLNAVYLDSHLLSILDREELRAVLAHELAHYHRYMSVFNRHFGLPILFTASAFVWGAVLAGNAFARFESVFGVMTIAVLAAVLHASVGWIGLMAFWALQRKREQEAELLCDYTAARYFGVLPQVNLMLKLASYNEVYQVLNEEVAGVLSTTTEPSWEEVVEAAEEVLPNRLVSAETARRLVRTRLQPLRGDVDIFRPPLKHDEDLDERRELVRGILRSRKWLRRCRHLSWRRYDDRVRDSRLDAVEWRAYLEAILGDEKALVIQADGEVDTDVADSHPPLRDRLLFLGSVLPAPRPDSCSVSDGGRPR